MKSKFLPILFFTLFSTDLLAAKHMLILGGGGEPRCMAKEKDPNAKCHETIFDTGLKTLGEKLKDSKWKHQAFFNGGHSKSEALMKKHFPSKENSDFTAVAYKRLIEDYKKKINSGEIKSQDELLIIIHTHGRENNGEQGHSVTTSTSAVNLDDMEGLMKLAEAKGIKLAIADMSCHSGNTQAYKKIAPNACIVTSTGPKHYAYTTSPTSFTELFLSNLKPGRSLENIFLKARRESNDSSYPMISTKQNDRIVQSVYENITPYLYYYFSDGGHLSDFMLQELKYKISCDNKLEDQFNDLILQVNNLQNNILGKLIAPFSAYNGDRLKSLLSRYKAAREKIIVLYQKENLDMILKTEKFSAPQVYKGHKEKDKNGKTLISSLTFSWKSVIDQSEIDLIIDRFQKATLESKTPTEKAQNNATVEVYKQVKVRRDEILKKYPALKEYNKTRLDLLKSINRELTSAIAVEERKLYDELYFQNVSFRSNPCRRFIF